MAYACSFQAVSWSARAALSMTRSLKGAKRSLSFSPASFMTSWETPPTNEWSHWPRRCWMLPTAVRGGVLAACEGGFERQAHTMLVRLLLVGSGRLLQVHWRLLGDGVLRSGLRWRLGNHALGRRRVDDRGIDG